MAHHLTIKSQAAVQAARRIVTQAINVAFKACYTDSSVDARESDYLAIAAVYVLRDANIEASGVKMLLAVQKHARRLAAAGGR